MGQEIKYTWALTDHKLEKVQVYNSKLLHAFSVVLGEKQMLKNFNVSVCTFDHVSFHSLNFYTTNEKTSELSNRFTHIFLSFCMLE